MQKDISGKLNGLYQELIVTHGAGLDANGYVTVHGKDRINKSVEIFRDSYAPKIMMGGKGSSRKMKEYAVREHGLSEDRIFLDDYSVNTPEELLNSRRNFLEPYKVENVISVSNYWHCPRIKILSEKIMRGYNWSVQGTVDSRSEEEKSKDVRAEIVKTLKSKIWLSTVYKFS